MPVSPLKREIRHALRAWMPLAEQAILSASKCRYMYEGLGVSQQFDAQLVGMKKQQLQARCRRTII